MPANIAAPAHTASAGGRFTVDDVDNVVLLDGDPQVMHYLSGSAPTPRDVIKHETLPRFFSYYECRERFGIWAAIEKTTGAFPARVG